jgi:hypothetical protein
MLSAAESTDGTQGLESDGIAASCQIVVPLLLLCIAFNFRQAHLRRYRYSSIDTCTYYALKVRSGTIDNVQLIYAHIAVSAHFRCWLDISITGSCNPFVNSSNPHFHSPSCLSTEVPRILKRVQKSSSCELTTFCSMTDTNRQKGSWA